MTPHDPAGAQAAAPERSGLRWLLVDALCLGALLLAAVKMVHGLDASMDLAMWDEPSYMNSGLMVAEGTLPTPEWGPLYAVWYFVLSRIWTDPVALYYANYQLLVVLTVGGTYVLMRRLRAQPALAFLGSAFYLMSAAPHIDPRPSLLALLILQAACIGATFCAAAESFWAMVAVGLLLASFVRPELFVPFLLVTAVLLFVVGRGVRKEGRAALPRVGRRLAGVGLLALGLIGVFGNPMSDTSNRRFYAFCQHFALTYVIRGGSSANPWDQCERTLQPVFGDARTMGDAFRNNSKEFLAHLRFNVPVLVKSSLALFIEGHQRATPLHGEWTVERVGRLMLWALVAWQFAMLAYRWKRFRTAMADPWLRRLVGILVAVEVPTVLSSVLFYPRSHYLVVQGVLIATFLAILGTRMGTWNEARPAGWMLRAVLVLGLVVSAPDFSRPSAAKHGATAALPERLRQVRTIKALDPARWVAPGEKVEVLEAHGGYAIYLGSRFQAVFHGHKREPFGEFVRKRGVDLIVLDELLRTDRRFVHDPEFLAFQKDPAAFGFRTMPLDGAGTTLAFPLSWGLGASKSSPE